MRRRSPRSRPLPRREWNFPPFRPERLHAHVIRSRQDGQAEFHPVRVTLWKDRRPWTVSIAITVTESLRNERKLNTWWLSKKLRIGFDWSLPEFKHEAPFKFQGGSVEESTVTFYVLCRPGMPALLEARKPIRVESLEVERSMWLIDEYDYRVAERSKSGKSDVPF